MQFELFTIKMSAVCVSGTFQETERDLLPSCFIKPQFTVWTLYISLPSTLESIGSFDYKGPSFHGALLLRNSDGMKMRVVASEPLSSLLPPSLVSSSPFPILSLSLPIDLRDDQNTYKIGLYFTSQLPLSTPYSLTFSSTPQPLPRPFSICCRPSFTLFFRASHIESFPVNISGTNYFILLKKNSLPFRFTLNFCDGTSRDVKEELQTVIHLSTSLLKTIKDIHFINPPFILKTSKKFA